MHNALQSANCGTLAANMINFISFFDPFLFHVICSKVLPLKLVHSQCIGNSKAAAHAVGVVHCKALMQCNAIQKTCIS